jgi:phosphoglycolate phosphatase-like HAD superfamily hydrolase
MKQLDDGSEMHSLVWDVDGTLLDTYPAIVDAIVSTLRECVDPEEISRDEVADLCAVSMDHCLSTLGAQFDLDLDSFRADYRQRYQAMSIGPQGPFPGAVTLCSYVKSKGGKNFILTHRSRSSLEKMLRFHHLTPLFSGIVAGDDGFPRKPDPSGLADLLDRHNLLRETTMLIGDRALDIEAAHAAGLEACLFGDNSVNEPVDYHVDNYFDLLALIKARMVSV